MAGKRAFQRRALRRPHPAWREVTCGDTDMDWPRLGAVLHTTRLWGRSYLGVGRRAASRTWQKLCHREDMGLPWGKPYRGRIHIWDYPKGNQAIQTPSPVQGLTGDPGELTVYNLACEGKITLFSFLKNPALRDQWMRFVFWGSNGVSQVFVSRFKICIHHTHNYTECNQQWNVSQVRSMDSATNTR